MMPAKGATTLAACDGLMTTGMRTVGPSAGGTTPISINPSVLSSLKPAYSSTGITSYLEDKATWEPPIRLIPSGTEIANSVPSRGG